MSTAAAANSPRLTRPSRHNFAQASWNPQSPYEETAALLLLALARLPALAQLPASNDVVVLNSWRIHDGDDLTWARPDFDDSKWTQTTSPARSNRFGHTAWISLVQNDSRAAQAASGARACHRHGRYRRGLRGLCGRGVGGPFWPVGAKARVSLRSGPDLCHSAGTHQRIHSAHRSTAMGRCDIDGPVSLLHLRRGALWPHARNWLALDGQRPDRSQSVSRRGSESALESLPAFDAGRRLHCIRSVQCAAQSCRIHFARHLLRRLSTRSLRGRIPGCERFRDAPLLGADPRVCGIHADHSEFLPLSFADLSALSALDSGGRAFECDSRCLCSLRLRVSIPLCEFMALHFRLQSAGHHYPAGGVGAASGTKSRFRRHRDLASARAIDRCVDQLFLPYAPYV